MFDTLIEFGDKSPNKWNIINKNINLFFFYCAYFYTKLSTFIF